ncbi:hypothetical protein BT69DRAFT_1317388 [Atractiella rhizophila]|nr:hypothetical protein BT69DRAFT_1317388 [Atractiella rhizophila]
MDLAYSSRPDGILAHQAGMERSKQEYRNFSYRLQSREDASLTGEHLHDLFASSPSAPVDSFVLTSPPTSESYIPSPSTSHHSYVPADTRDRLIANPRRRGLPSRSLSDGNVHEIPDKLSFTTRAEYEFGAIDADVVRMQAEAFHGGGPATRRAEEASKKRLREQEIVAISSDEEEPFEQTYTSEARAALRTVPQGFFSILRLFQDLVEERRAQQQWRELRGQELKNVSVSELPAEPNWLPYQVTIETVRERFLRLNIPRRSWRNGWEAYRDCNTQRIEQVSMDPRQQDIALSVGWHGIGSKCRKYFATMARLSGGGAGQVDDQRSASYHYRETVKRPRLAYSSSHSTIPTAPSLDRAFSSFPASSQPVAYTPYTAAQTSPPTEPSPLSSYQLSTPAVHSVSHQISPSNANNTSITPCSETPPTQAQQAEIDNFLANLGIQSTPDNWSGVPIPNNFVLDANNNVAIVAPELQFEGDVKPRLPFASTEPQSQEPSGSVPSSSAFRGNQTSEVETPSDDSKDVLEVDLNRPYPSMGHFDMCGQVPLASLTRPENWDNPLRTALNTAGARRAAAIGRRGTDRRRTASRGARARRTATESDAGSVTSSVTALAQTSAVVSEYQGDLSSFLRDTAPVSAPPVSSTGATHGSSGNDPNASFDELFRQYIVDAQNDTQQ